MPVTERGGFVALLYLNHEGPREWPDEEIAFVREVAQRTRVAIERRRAEEELRRWPDLERRWSSAPSSAIASGAVQRHPRWSPMRTRA